MNSSNPASSIGDAFSNLTNGQAAAIGAFTGAFVTVAVIIWMAWLILQIIADWKIFTKANRPGWKCLIPFYSNWVEYDICWKAPLGLAYVISAMSGYVFLNFANTISCVCGAILVSFAVVLHIVESFKLARSFGRGNGFAICLVFFGPIARIILGFGKSQFVGISASNVTVALDKSEPSENAEISSESVPETETKDEKTEK